MKIDFLTLSVIVLLITLVPFFFTPVLGIFSQNTLVKRFKAESLKLKINISFKLQWNTNIAGIDVINKQFLFLQSLDQGIKTQQVDLNQVIGIKLHSQSNKFKYNNSYRETLSLVELEFYQANSDVPIRINLFNDELNFVEDHEIENAQKLMTELQKYVCAKPVMRHSA